MATVGRAGCGEPRGESELQKAVGSAQPLPKQDQHRAQQAQRVRISSVRPATDQVFTRPQTDTCHSQRRRGLLVPLHRVPPPRPRMRQLAFVTEISIMGSVWSAGTNGHNLSSRPSALRSLKGGVNRPPAQAHARRTGGGCWPSPARLVTDEPFTHDHVRTRCARVS